MKTNQISSATHHSVTVKVIVTFSTAVVLILNACSLFAQETAYANEIQLPVTPKTNNEIHLTHFEKGLIKMEQGQLKDAIDYLSKAAKEEPDNAGVLEKLGLAYGKMKEYRKAVGYFDQAILLDNKNPDYFYDRALAESYLDKIERSINDCDKAIALDNNFAEAYLVRGISKSVIGEVAGSMEDLKKAASLKSNYSEAYYNIGLNYYELRDELNARLNFNKASELGYPVEGLADYLKR
jgi:tetratricopeptide (TPR) repeat protein